MKLPKKVMIAAILFSLVLIALPACTTTVTTTAVPPAVTKTVSATTTVTSPAAATGKVMPSEANPLVIDTVNREIRMAGKVNGVGFTTPSWHVIVYKNGKAAPAAPFQAFISPDFFFNALAFFGGKPGDNMPATNYAGTYVQGSAVEMFVTWAGASKNYSLAEITKNPGAKAPALKFGGNYERNFANGTGCIVCYYSCPLGIVSNSAYNGDDSAAHKATQGGVLLDKAIVPADGTPVVFTFKVTP